MTEWVTLVLKELKPKKLDSKYGVYLIILHFGKAIRSTVSVSRVIPVPRKSSRFKLVRPFSSKIPVSVTEE